MRSNRCNSCEVMMINGVRCHEHGCPNKEADAKRQERNRRARLSRKARHEALTSLGLVQCKDSAGRFTNESLCQRPTGEGF